MSPDRTNGQGDISERTQGREEPLRKEEDREESVLPRVGLSGVIPVELTGGGTHFAEITNL